MKKLRFIVSLESFWAWWAGTAALFFALETFLFGKWAIPIVAYRVPYMNAITQWDIIFAGVFALLIGLEIALFKVVRKFDAVSCSFGSVSGVLALFTLLCPVCPVFFLAYFGSTATLMAFAPYFWWIRLVALVFLIGGIYILWQQLEPHAPKKLSGYLVAQKIGIIVIGVLLVVNQAMAMRVGLDLLGPKEEGGTVVGLSGDFSRDIAALTTPTELSFYAKELGLDMSNLNAINASIGKLATMAPKQGSAPIELTSEEMKRYVAIGTEPTITCEFCCGAKTLVTEDGAPTCGCAHSIAMRGTVAYLIRNHPELSNADISYELMRQKGLYFPTQMQKRMASAFSGEEKDFTPDIRYLTMRLTEQEIEELQKKAKESGFEPETKAPGMVGGC